MCIRDRSLPPASINLRYFLEIIKQQVRQSRAARFLAALLGKASELGPLRKDFRAVVGYQDGVFPVGGGAAVRRDDRPAIDKHFDLFLAQHEHRFNRQRHALAQQRARAWLAVIRDAGVFVQAAADAVAAEVAHDRAAPAR